MQKLTTSIPQNTPIKSRTVQASPFFSLALPRVLSHSRMYALSFVLATSPLLAPICLPTYAQAETSNGKTETYNDTFTDLSSNIQVYHLFAGNVGDATNYGDRSDASSATANNNTFFVKEGAAMSAEAASTSTKYEMNGAAAHIALYGDVTAVTANGNASSISGGYIANLYGAYIGINALVFNDYVKTTLSTLTANDNSIVMEEGTVGQGLQNQDSGLVLYNVGKSLAAVHVVSYNTNDDATFYLNNNSVYISGGTVVSTIGSDAKEGALTGAYLSTVLGEATMSNNSVTITGGDVQAKRIAGATFYTCSLENIETNFPSTSSHDLSDVSDQWSFDQHDTSVTMFNNSVTISSADGVFNSFLIAGAYANVSNTAEMYNNTVYISAGSFTSTNNSEPIVITGAYLKPIQPFSIDIEANDGAGGYIIEGTVSMKAYGNSVTVTGGIIEGLVSGATIYVEYSGQSTTYINSLLEYEGTISNNTVTVYGGEITSDDYGDSGIYGGLYQGVNAEGSTSIYGDKTWSIINTYSITDNTVNIGFDASLGNTIVLLVVLIITNQAPM
ncbi:MAG: hypothetical protein R3Y11_02980 [Pseudomonadota bacterium]